ncbi:hypothetical protein [Corynebacterium glyciniphilum]|uniref:hypothetical protein n=1 Tax=Corynebacterium glyciniphilum TaxID=1404244 RepID=UPI003FD64A95
MTATAVEPDPNVYPIHPAVTWEHALVCQVAGIPVPPESLQALAAHDSRPDKRGDGLALQRQRKRVIRALRDLVGTGEVVSAEHLAGRAEDPQGAADLLRGLTPIGATVGEDERRPYGLAGGGHGLCRTYLSADTFTVSGHFLARGPLALLAFRGKHLRKGRTDPLSPPTATPQTLETTPAPVPAPEPVVPTPEPTLEPAVPSVPEVAALDPVTARVKRSARRVLRDMPGLTVRDLAVEVWVSLDAEVDEPDIVDALETLETLGHADNDQHLEGAAA